MGPQKKKKKIRGGGGGGGGGGEGGSEVAVKGNYFFLLLHNYVYYEEIQIDLNCCIRWLHAHWSLETKKAQQAKLRLAVHVQDDLLQHHYHHISLFHANRLAKYISPVLWAVDAMLPLCSSYARKGSSFKRSPMHCPSVLPLAIDILVA